MSLSSDEIEILDSHHYVQGYDSETIHSMHTGRFWVMDMLDQQGLIEIDNTFFPSSGMTYVQTTPKGLQALRDHRLDIQRRIARYIDEALF